MIAIATPRTLSRAGYERLELDTPDRSLARVDLSDNTNRWGMPPAAARALRDAGAATYTRYPDAYAAPLKEALAEYCGVEADCIATGCGSDDVLDSAIRAFAEPGDRLATCDPSFAMVPSFARMNGLSSVAIPLTASYEPDAAALTAANARVVYLCSPNNPTGSSASRPCVEAIVDGARAVVIIDEAYAEFARGDVLALARSRPNVLVVRTLSKAFGLAGLRVGYAIGAPALIREVEKSRGPYKVSATSAAAAMAALRDDLGWVREHVRLAQVARGRLRRDLERRGLTVLPSEANFVLAPMREAAVIARRMRDRGVAVRAFPRLPPISPALHESLGGALRITVGPPDEIAQMLDALDTVRAECA